MELGPDLPADGIAVLGQFQVLEGDLEHLWKLCQNLGSAEIQSGTSTWPGLSMVFPPVPISSFQN